MINLSVLWTEPNHWQSVCLSPSGKNLSFSPSPQCGSGKRSGTRDGGTGLHPTPREPDRSLGCSSPPWVRDRAMMGARSHSRSRYQVAFSEGYAGDKKNGSLLFTIFGHSRPSKCQLRSRRTMLYCGVVTAKTGSLKEVSSLFTPANTWQEPATMAVPLPRITPTCRWERGKLSVFLPCHRFETKSNCCPSRRKEMKN